MSRAKEIGFPELTDSYLAGQDILYAQFNDIEFYVEDTEQEHFYFNILKKLFPDLQFEKIFPLNGKTKIKDDARANVGNKKKVYITDLDFDQILGTIENLDNLFYLEKYSIENHLFSKSAIYELIRMKNSKLKDADIDALFDYNALLELAANCLKEIASAFVLIKQHSLGLHYYRLNISRDFDITTASPSYRMNFIKNYLIAVEAELKNKNRNFSLKAQIRKIKKHFNDLVVALINIPGKYILTFIKERLQALNLINKVTIETFTYTLSKDFNPNELDYLRINITEYIR